MDKYFCLIGHYRKEKTNLNQREFGDLFNITQQTISNWESGRGFPPYPILKAMANYFELECVDDLYQKMKK